MARKRRVLSITVTPRRLGEFHVSIRDVTITEGEGERMRNATLRADVHSAGAVETVLSKAFAAFADSLDRTVEGALFPAPEAPPDDPE